MVLPLQEKTRTSTTNDDDLSNAFESEINTKTERARNQIVTRFRMRKENFRRGLHTIKSGTI